MINDKKGKYTVNAAEEKKRYREFLNEELKAAKVLGNVEKEQKVEKQEAAERKKEAEKGRLQGR